MRSHLIALALLIVPTAASAVEYLTGVVSDVHQAEGMSATQIAERGLQCIKSTGGNSAEYVDPAIDGTTAYAIVRTSYSSMMVNTILRSRLSVVARDGRFKVAHTDIERYYDPARTYLTIQKGWGTGWEKAQAVLQDRATEVAACVINKPSQPVAGGDW